MHICSQQASQQRSVGRLSSCLRFQNTGVLQEGLSLARPWQVGQDRAAFGGSTAPVHGAAQQFGYVSCAGFQLQTGVCLCGTGTVTDVDLASAHTEVHLTSLLPFQLGCQVQVAAAAAELWQF